MREETSAKTQQTAIPASLYGDVDSRSVAHWWRRPVSSTSRSSKAVCVLAAAFALTAVLGFAPSKAVAEELGNAGTAYEETSQAQAADDSSGQQSSADNGSDVRSMGQVSATVPDSMGPHMQPAMESSASLSLAAAYVSEEQDESADGSGDDDATRKDAANELNGEVLTSTGNGAAVQVGAGESLAVQGSTIIALATTGSSALSVADGGVADVAAASTLSARGENSTALACTGTGSVACLSDSSAYASGEKCAAIAASDGAIVSMERGSLEATLGAVVRAEGPAATSLSRRRTDSLDRLPCWALRQRDPLA